MGDKDQNQELVERGEEGESLITRFLFQELEGLDEREGEVDLSTNDFACRETIRLELAYRIQMEESL